MAINPLQAPLSGRVCFLLAAGALLLSAALAPTAGAEPAVLAVVGGDAITTNDLEEILAVQKRPDRGAPDTTRLTSEGLLRRMIQNRLFEQEGYRSGIDQAPQIRNQVWDLTRHYGMIALLDSVSADVPRTEPEELGPALAQVNLIQRVSHILVDSEALASSLVDSLAAGASFALLVERYSQDSTTVKKGGDLGWGRADLYIPEFREVLQGAEEGDILGPVQTKDGWHVLQLAEIHAETIGQTAAMRAQIRDAIIEERVMAKVREYVESLKAKYEYTVDENLLASLDYASKDPEVHKELRRSKEVLASVTWRSFTVADFTREIRFEHYHGLHNKPNAAEIRDETFEDWVTELILRHETGVQGFDRRPEILAGAKRLERNLVREHVLNEIGNFRFEPEPEEVERYYATHPEQFTPDPRLKAAGVFLRDEAAALAFRTGLQQGAKVAWLAARTPGVLDPDPELFGDWIQAAELGVAGAAKQGALFGPIESNGIWAAGTILEIEKVVPTPLDQCRPAVVGAMKLERTREVLAKSVERLEAATKIEIQPDAHELINARLAQWVAGPVETPTP